MTVSAIGNNSESGTRLTLPRTSTNLYFDYARGLSCSDLYDKISTDKRAPRLLDNDDNDIFEEDRVRARTLLLLAPLLERLRTGIEPFCQPGIILT